jgi:DsbC/DsbD-like thiol-disulfide interchange protein
MVKAYPDHAVKGKWPPHQSDHNEFSSTSCAPPARSSKMNATGIRQIACAAAACLVTGSGIAAAADASAWVQDTKSATRLIAGDGTRPAADGALRAGVEIKLARGWKTYWRYPGDSGVPPRFDFAASDNVKSVTVLWPAPHRFRDDAGESIGYKEQLILPLRVIPRDASQPVTLRLDLEYGVCEKLCVPVQTKAELTLARAPSTLDAALAAAEAQVPVPTQLGQGSALAISAVRQQAGGKPPQVVVDVKAPDHVALDLFAEGPTADWALPLPTPAAGAPAGYRRFSFALDGLPPGSKPDGATLTLTAVAGTDAIEVKARLD